MNQPNPFTTPDLSTFAAPESTRAAAHALFARAPGPSAKPRHEPEPTDGVAGVQVSIVWGDAILHLEQLSPPRPFFVGTPSSKAAPVDFVVPEERLGAPRLPLVLFERGVPYAVTPAGTKIPLENGASAELAFGDLVCRIKAVVVPKTPKRGIFSGFGGRMAAYFGLSAAVTAALIGAAAAFAPPLGITEDEGLNKDQLYAMKAYLDATAEEDVEPEPLEPSSASGGEQQGGGAAPAEGEQGAAGDPQKNQAGHAAWKGPKNNPEPTLSRAEAIELASTFGMVALLTGDESRHVSAPWAMDTSGSDAVDAVGDLFSDDLADGWGRAGLHLENDGSGGGGRAKVIGLFDGPGCDSFFCPGRGDERGKFVGWRRKGGMPEHQVKPVDGWDPTTTVSGRIPPAAIQRIVRNNYGRFRACYETGLRTNPSLAGRVTTRFVIDRDGKVANAASGGSDLPDSGVVSCVVSKFYSLSFPKPEGGVVTVSYPIMFAPVA